MTLAESTPSRTLPEKFAADMYISAYQVIRLVSFVAYCVALWRA